MAATASGAPAAATAAPAGLPPSHFQAAPTTSAAQSRSHPAYHHTFPQTPPHPAPHHGPRQHQSSSGSQQNTAAATGFGGSPANQDESSTTTSHHYYSSSSAAATSAAAPSQHRRYPSTSTPATPFDASYNTRTDGSYQQRQHYDHQHHHHRSTSSTNNKINTNNTNNSSSAILHSNNSHSRSKSHHYSRTPSHTPTNPPVARSRSQQHHSQQHRRGLSVTQDARQASSQNDHESSNVISHHRHRSSSRDRPPPTSRGGDSSRVQRRGSTKANNPPHHLDMAPTATADHGSHASPEAGSRHHQSSSAKATRSRTAIPTQSGNWILGRTIGSGSMGKVKLARKEDGNEQVACKIIPRGSTDDSHQSRADKERADQSKEIRTAREAAIVTLLNHPYICGLRDVVRTNYHWYMLFEFVNGGQMLDYIISHGKLKEKQARKFSRQIASALDYCHRNSIVHRDLKIENILIGKTGDIKIIDFGLSNLFAPRGHLKTFCGSLYFAAPELLQARVYMGPEVDVWSFGIVLYVLVCGKVPFDDQSMPALHAKIKKGYVDYPSWVSSECKHLMSRMLVTDPKQRATMAEVMNHPWMTKGFSGPPDNYVSHREPLTAPLDEDVVNAMQGFNFGSPESINAQLLKIIESEEYVRAVKMYQREREVPQPKDPERKRPFGLDFYKRRNSSNSRDTLTGPSSEALQLGNDPLNAFSPLLSIYYLVKEKQEREKADKTSSPNLAMQVKEKEKERQLENEKTAASQRDSRRSRDRDVRREREGEKQGIATATVPELAPPQEAHTNSAAYEMPGEKPTGGRSRPRARTHGEDDAPESAKQQPAQVSTPDSKADQLRKEGTAAGLLRRFSTRKRREPERLEKDRSHPPTVQVHSPSDAGSTVPRKSFSIRRGRRDRDERVFSNEDPSQRSELLTPTREGLERGSRGNSGLGRSTSVNSGDMRRRESARGSRPHPPPTSGSEQSVMTEEPPSAAQRSHGHGHGHSMSVTMRAKSLGHARRESIQQRRQRREAAHEANVPEETDQELEQDQYQSGVSTERLDDSELNKPVYLKGLFSVSTTSGKSVAAIRSEMRKVLKQLNVEYTEIKGGFSCKHAPSIDLNRLPSHHHQPEQPGSPAVTPGHRRRFSFGGLMRGDDKGDKEEGLDYRGSDRAPPTPTPAGRDRDGNTHTNNTNGKDRSYTNSETSVDSIPRRTTEQRRRAPGETSTQVQSDLDGSMVLEFDIFIVKVPLLSLHGIQFKRITGNTWQFKGMADQILKALRL